MSVLVVGSVALDSVETPRGRIDNAIGGSAVYFSAAASLFVPVYVVGVVGSDYPLEQLTFLCDRGVCLDGLERADGPSFRWAGVYLEDWNTRRTLRTELGVFATFRPVVPPAARRLPWVFLANIDPRLQLDVLGQMERPRFVACDTMNFWIQQERSVLETLLGRVDLVLLNDAEARELAGEWNLVRAARAVLRLGPRWVVIKKGEHGALLFGQDEVFALPAYPLDDCCDPTGAGDAFAGGFLGALAREDRADAAALRRAMLYGAALGAYAVEGFSVGRLRELTPDAVEERVAALRGVIAP